MNKISHGTIHKLPLDLRQILVSSKNVLETWENISPLARNEFICWIESAKKKETRQRRIRRTYEELKDGKKRPCCWAGCKHR